MKNTSAYPLEPIVSVVLIGTEQPETCRECGARTEFDEVNSQLQLHQCCGCGNQYFVEFDD